MVEPNLRLRGFQACTPASCYQKLEDQEILYAVAWAGMALLSSEGERTQRLPLLGPKTSEANGDPPPDCLDFRAGGTTTPTVPCVRRLSGAKFFQEESYT